MPKQFSYNYIVNPKTGRKVLTHGKLGQKIIKGFLANLRRGKKEIKGGGRDTFKSLRNVRPMNPEGYSIWSDYGIKRVKFKETGDEEFYRADGMIDKGDFDVAIQKGEVASSDVPHYIKLKLDVRWAWKEIRWLIDEIRQKEKEWGKISLTGGLGKNTKWRAFLINSNRNSSKKNPIWLRDKGDIIKDTTSGEWSVVSSIPSGSVKQHKAQLRVDVQNKWTRVGKLVKEIKSIQKEYEQTPWDQRMRGAFPVKKRVPNDISLNSAKADLKKRKTSENAVRTRPFIQTRTSRIDELLTPVTDLTRQRAPSDDFRVGLDSDITSTSGPLVETGNVPGIQDFQFGLSEGEEVADKEMVDASLQIEDSEETIEEEITSPYTQEWDSANKQF